MRKPKIINIRELNGDPVVSVFTKRESRWFRTVSRTWFKFQQEWKLLVEFEDGKDIHITIPAGYESNGASIPLAARGLLSAQRILKTSFAHDFLYGTGRYARWMADLIFRFGVCSLCGCPKWKAYVAWAGVRLGGKGNFNWTAWNKRNS